MAVVVPACSWNTMVVAAATAVAVNKPHTVAVAVVAAAVAAVVMNKPDFAVAVGLTARLSFPMAHSRGCFQNRPQ